MKLYYRPGSCALAPHITLEMLAETTDLAYDAEEVTDEMLGSAAYRAINPRSQVPALVTDEGILTESVGISIYLADRHGGGALAPPPGSFARGEMMMRMLYLATQGHPRFGILIRPFRFTSDPENHDDLRDHARVFLDGVLQTLDGWLAGRTWLMDEQFTVADAYALVHEAWGLRYGKTTRAYPNVWRHMKAVAALPAVGRVLEKQGFRLDLE